MKLQLIHTDNYLIAVDDSNYYDEYYLNKVDMRIYKRDGGGNIPTVGGVWHKNHPPPTTKQCTCSRRNRVAATFGR